LDKLTIIDDLKKSNPQYNKLKCDNSLECEHCLFQKAEDSIPTKAFKIYDSKLKKEIIIKKIKISRGRYDDCMGWQF